MARISRSATRPLLMASSQRFRHILLCSTVLICFFLVVFEIGFTSTPSVAKHSLPPSTTPNYGDKLVFWSSDFHITPIHDLKNLLVPLNVHFIDKSLSSVCNTYQTCAKDLRIITQENGMSSDKALREQFYQAYKNDSTMNLVDAFVCFHPAAMCELFMPFNRTIIVIASTRYELARSSPDDWNQWNQNLRIIASNPRNVVAGNNLYDAEYIRYFTGIHATVIPSICAFTETTYHPAKTYRPGKPHLPYIFVPARSYTTFNKVFLDELTLSLNKSNSTIAVKSLRDVYATYTYKDLARHPALIYLPYQVSTMSIFEQYFMNIPLFFPSLDLLTEWHLKHYILSERTWAGKSKSLAKYPSAIPRYDLNSTVPDPNNENDHASIHYWLKFADFYQLPHITYFSSIDDLTVKLLNANLKDISEQMSKYNRVRRTEVLERWKTILNGISTSPFTIEKNKNKKMMNSV